MKASLPVRGLILAAGKGTRMKSDLAKVLHPIWGKPMLEHVLAAVNGLELAGLAVVVGHQADRVQEALAGRNLAFVLQERQNGTGHAVLCAEPVLGREGGLTLILCGDTPLIRTETLKAFLAQHQERRPLVTLMTTELAEPFGYGRIVHTAGGAVCRIVEEKDASPEERRIRTINAGIYCADTAFLFAALARVGTDNSQGEVYLTDIVSQATAGGGRVDTFPCADPMEVLGVNSRRELAQAGRVLQERLNRQHMAAGVTMADPATVWIQGEVAIGPDTVLEPQVLLKGPATIGRGCHLGPFLVLERCRLGDGVRVGPFNHLVDCQLPAGATVPPGLPAGNNL
ncbi:MAG: NTP transferase domain-containing protein [Thermodesulfobacteriota bacterium]